MSYDDVNLLNTARDAQKSAISLIISFPRSLSRKSMSRVKYIYCLTANAISPVICFSNWKYGGTGVTSYPEIKMEKCLLDRIYKYMVTYNFRYFLLPLNALSQGYMAPLYPLISAWCLALSSVLVLVLMMALPIFPCNSWMGGYIQVSWSQNTWPLYICIGFI